MTGRFDLDDIGDWAPRLALALDEVVPLDARERIRTSSTGSHQDALDIVLSRSDPDRLFETTRRWVRDQKVVAYHASRLSEAEIASVRATGIQPLVPWRRRERLVAILSRHALWPEVADRLDEVIEMIAGSGRREGQAHLTLSRGTLVKFSTHYLSAGSEFDQAVALEMLGRDAVALLCEGRFPVLFAVAVPGARALEVTEWRTPDGEMSGLVRLVLRTWADWLCDPAIDPSSSRIDFGLVFHEVIPADWLLEVLEVTESSEIRSGAEPCRH